MNDKNIRWTAEIVSGTCPTCSEFTSLVGITKEFYRCLTCGHDCKQHVNGKIDYVRVVHPPDGRKPYVRDW